MTDGGGDRKNKLGAESVELSCGSGLLCIAAEIAGFGEDEREAIELAFVTSGFRVLYREARDGPAATVL